MPPRTLPTSRSTSPRPGNVTARARGAVVAYFPGHGFVPCDVYSRYALTAGTRLRGPAIVEERKSTVVVGFDADIVIDEQLNLIVELEPGRDVPSDKLARER